MDYKDSIQTLLDNLCENLHLRGQSYRKEVITPFCEKYGLKFLSGNRDYFFYEGDQNWMNSPIFQVEGKHLSVYLKPGSKLLKSKRFAKEVGSIFEVLNMEVSYADHFGFYV